jgi:DNA-binding beta-propeller fold protein YncE
MINKTFFYFLILTFSLVILGSCSKKISKTNAPPELVFYPPPPDTTRIQYLTSISASTDVLGKQSAFNKFMFGENLPQPILKPYGVTVSKSRIYICDTGLGGLILIDLSDNSFAYFTPSGRGQLQLPLNCAVDENGILFVADGNRRQIVVFDRDEKYLAEFGEASESYKPTDICIFGNNIYVTSVKDQKIYIYDKDNYKLVSSFPESEPGDDSYLYQPTNLFVNQNGIYVSDMGDNKVKLYSPQGKFLNAFGGFGTYMGQLTRPKGITVDDKSNLFVVDAAFENVQVFNKAGNVLMFFGGPYTKPGDMWLPADVTVSYTGQEFFRKYVDDSFILKYLIFVTNQFGPDKVSVYGFVQ